VKCFGKLLFVTSAGAVNQSLQAQDMREGITIKSQTKFIYIRFSGINKNPLGSKTLMRSNNLFFRQLVASISCQQLLN
jgi:hypothetical protein